MKHFNLPIIVGISVFLFFSSAFASDFRGSNWGDSRAKVTRTERAESLGMQGKTLAFKDSIAGLDALIGYQFIDHKLETGIIGFPGSHSNPAEYIDDFDSINKLLISKYGKPRINRKQWQTENHEGMSEGMALATGYLIFFSEWDLPHLRIRHYLNGDNLSVSHGIVYSNPAVANGARHSDSSKL